MFLQVRSSILGANKRETNANSGWRAGASLTKRLTAIGALLFLSASAGSLSVADGDVRARLNLADPAIGPFPADQFTVPDGSQITGRRVEMPKPDCGAQPSDCDEISILNTLDGFNLETRFTISFDGSIAPYSVSGKTAIDPPLPRPREFAGGKKLIRHAVPHRLGVDIDQPDRQPVCRQAHQVQVVAIPRPKHAQSPGRPSRGG